MTFHPPQHMKLAWNHFEHPRIYLNSMKLKLDDLCLCNVQLCIQALVETLSKRIKYFYSIESGNGKNVSNSLFFPLLSEIACKWLERKLWSYWIKSNPNFPGNKTLELAEAIESFLKSSVSYLYPFSPFRNGEKGASNLSEESIRFKDNWNAYQILFVSPNSVECK